MIPFFDYRPHYHLLREQIDGAIRRVLESGRLILGPEVEAFEREFAAFVGVPDAVGVNSGTDALILALRALDVGPGDEVITVANAGVPPVAAIRAVGAVPRFVDVSRSSLTLDPGMLEKARTDRTRCIVPVHLYGFPASIAAIVGFAERHGIAVVEDCAQAHGARVGGRHVGTFGAIGCFSFYPTKNLGAFGDGGAVVSSNAALLERMRSQRMYGFRGDRVAREDGLNTRLDELQAAVLRVKLAHLDQDLATRRELARLYREGLAQAKLDLPASGEDVVHAYHLFVVRAGNRESLIRRLESHRIGYGLHYPDAVHLMPPYATPDPAGVQLPETEAACREVLSLPLFVGLDRNQIGRVLSAVSSST